MSGDLFSVDDDLFRFEPDLKCFLPDAQSDYLPQHIAAKDVIVEELIRSKILDTVDGHEDAESQLLRPEELNLLSIYKVLEIVFSFVSSSGSDKFSDKAIFYRSLYLDELEKVKKSLTVDTNKDGKVQDGEVQFSHISSLKRA